MSKPPYDQGKRVYDGIMPEYWHRVEISLLAPTIEQGVYWRFDYGTSTEVIAAIIEVEYDGSDFDIANIVRIEKVYPAPGPWP